MKRDWKEWLYAAAIRAIKTMAQSAAAAIGACALWSDVDWKVVGSTALLAGVLSLITSLLGLPEVSTVSDENTESERKDE